MRMSDEEERTRLPELLDYFFSLLRCGQLLALPFTESAFFGGKRMESTIYLHVCTIYDRYVP
jgi:hypothetical protein